MKFDDASWHYEGDYPDDMPDSAAATHIGMFLAWALLHGMAGEELADDSAEALAALQRRELSGAQFLITELDEKLIDEDLNAEGAAFALAYYVGDDHDSRYIDDYFAAFSVDEASLYRVPDTWEHYERLAPAIDARYARWIREGRPQYVV